MLGRHQLPWAEYDPTDWDDTLSSSEVAYRICYRVGCRVSEFSFPPYRLTRDEAICYAIGVIQSYRYRCGPEVVVQVRTEAYGSYRDEVVELLCLPSGKLAIRDERTLNFQTICSTTILDGCWRPGEPYDGPYCAGLSHRADAETISRKLHERGPMTLSKPAETGDDSPQRDA
jgi:hypothetical protein